MSEQLLLTVAEAAAILGVSRSRAYELVMSGQLRSVKLGRARRVPRKVLDEFIDSLLTSEAS